MQAMPVKATTTSGCKHPQLQLSLSHTSKAMSLVETACVQETS
jgi:hypothetical protein